MEIVVFALNVRQDVFNALVPLTVCNASWDYIYLVEAVLVVAFLILIAHFAIQLNVNLVSSATI